MLAVTLLLKNDPDRAIKIFETANTDPTVETPPESVTCTTATAVS